MDARNPIVTPLFFSGVWCVVQATLTVLQSIAGYATHDIHAARFHLYLDGPVGAGQFGIWSASAHVGHVRRGAE